MAKARSVRSHSDKPKSNAVLIIFLIFFILATIGAGIFGYSGYTSTEGKDAEVKKAKDDALKADTEKKLAEYAALKYAAMMGFGDEARKRDLDDYDRQLNDAASNEGWKRLEGVTKIRATVKSATEALQKIDKTKPPPNFVEALKIQDDVIVKAKSDIAPKEGKVNEAEKRAGDAKSELEAAQLAYKNELEAIKKAIKDKQDALIAQTMADKKTIEDLQKKLTDVQTAAANKEKELKAAEFKLTKDIEGLKNNITRLEAEISKTVVSENEFKVADIQLRSVGRVVDRRGDSAFLDLGQLQKLAPQVTFSVHALGVDGYPVPQSKGSVEVITIFDSGSQARISVERNKENPIQKGDVLVNPNWNPDRKRRVAVTGFVDLTGEGRNQFREFRLLLERQNVELDAWLEPTDKDWELKGKGLTRDTNYLIIANDLPDNRANADLSKALSKHVSKMKEDARQNGVMLISLPNYLDMIGYVPPRGLGETSGYRPIGGKEPMPPMPPMPMPMPPMPPMPMK